MEIREIIQTLFLIRTWKLAAIIAGGVFCGLGSYTLYASQTRTYSSDDPTTCVNCHTMGPYYATWSHSSHSRNATCNDCHVLHENAMKKWFFKGIDGTHHVSVFTVRGEPQVIQTVDRSAEVTMNDCIRCHTQLNTEFVNAGRIDHEMVMTGEREAYWDCHREVPHGSMNSLFSASSVLVSYPESVSPDWLEDMLNK